MIKENIKSKEVLAQNIQKIWDTMQRSNVRIVRKEEGEETQVKDTENTFHKIMDFPNLKKEIPIKVKDHAEYKKDWTRKEIPNNI